MKPSVVIIGPAYPLRGGLASFNERLAREFHSQGMHTCIYTFSLQYPGFLFPGSTQYSSDPPPGDLDIRVKINSINPLNWLHIGLELKRLKPDIIVVRYWLPFMGPCLGSILRIARKNDHSRVVCIADNIIPHEKRKGDTLFTRYFVKAADAFITMSEKVLKDLEQFTNLPARQVNHPLYDNFGDALSAAQARNFLGLNADIPIVLFFGFIRKYKGLDLLIEAIHLLKQEQYFSKHPLKFLIAGEFYDDPKPYLEFIRNYELDEHIILKNEFIADRDVKYYLSAADCVIQPYKNATQSGVTPLAYHFEKPMIVTRVGGLPQLVPPGVGLVAEPTAQSLAQKIREFFTLDPRQFAAHIREEKKKYSWQIITDTIVSLAQSSTHDLQK